MTARTPGSTSTPGTTGTPGSPRRAVRSAEDSYLGGVCGGLGAHLGVHPDRVRAVFLLLAVLGGLGVLLYAGLWLTLPLDRAIEARSPGLESATRQGRRPPRPRRLRDTGPMVALAALLLGVGGLLSAVLGGAHLWWPALVAILGVAVLWRHADDAQRERWVDTGGSLDLRRILLGRGGPAAWGRLAAGVGLLVSALVLFAIQTGPLSVARDVLLAGVLGMVGLGLTVGPWLVRLTSDLSEERASRVRTEERADVAAHLHDSVLQTLALIQRNAGDAAEVARLARAQERDLRSWMYAEAAPAASTVAESLRAVAAEAEDRHGVPVEVVTVGDAPADALAPLVQAAREAVSNAVRHSGAAQVDVYAEMAADEVEVFVRDRGRGFDPDTVPEDRMGVRTSIVDRMARHGGAAVVRTAPGSGTEVRLTLPRREAQPPSRRPSAPARGRG